MSEVGVHGSEAVSPSDRIEFRVLGPVEAQQNDRLIALGGPRQRTLLSLLLLHQGMVVSTDELVDAIWAGEPPDGAATTIRSYVSRLRAALGQTAQLDASASGYTIRVDADSIDATLFDRLVRAADEDLARGRARAASDQLGRALSLWRGRAFGELSDEGPLRVEAERLDELRLHALEERYAAEIQIGRAASVIDELESAVGMYPFRERLWRELMQAMYYSGRQADALSTYQRARKMLDEQLGIDPSPELQELEGRILRQEMPPVGRAAHRSNLPAPQTSFVGRTAELNDLAALMRDARLITLTGVGGVGKTRLAVEAARIGNDVAPDGVVFADLAVVTPDDDVARSVARTLDLREQAGLTATEQVVAELGSSRVVVLLDNCEHVRDDAASLCAALLARCPEVRILATSRTPLGLDGEVEFALAPLTTPAEGATLEELRGSDAVRLLVERVAASRLRGSDAEQDPDAALIEAARICRDLDGLPLAIELAAARAKVMSLNEIAGRLDDRFRFLVSWRRMSAARHQTLKEAIDWSFDLLSADDQRVFATLAAFVGGFTLDAVAHVSCGGDTHDALEAVTRLVDASLVVAEPGAGAVETRYRLLETVRQYAAALPAEAADMQSVREAHATYFQQLAERAEPELSGAHQAQWFARLDAEHGNFVAALSYMAMTGSNAEALLEFTVALTRFWYVRGYLADAQRALETALAASPDAPTLLRRRGLTAAASVALLQGDYSRSTRYAEASLEAARQSGEDRLVANGLSNLGAIVLAAGDQRRAAELLREAVDLARTVADTRILALALNNLGDHALTVADYANAEPLFAESLALLQERGDTSNVARSLFNLGAVALMTDRLEEADERFRRSLATGQEAGDKEDLAWSLLGLAAVNAVTGRAERSATLLGAAVALLSDMGADFKPFERMLHAQTESRLVDQLGQQTFRRTLEQGRALSLPSAIEVATQT